MKRFFSVFLVALVLCCNVFAAEFDDGKGFRIVEDLGDGTSVITFDDYDYYVVSNVEIATGEIAPTVSIAWSPRDDKKEEVKNEVVDSSSPAVSDVGNISTSESVNNPLLSQAIENGNSVYVLSGDGLTYDDATAPVLDGMQYVGTQLMSLSPVTETNSTGFKAVLLGLLGNYDTIVTVHQYQSSSQGYYSTVTDVQPDYVWLTGAALLLLLIYCLFRLGGALIHG